jgi:aryl-alcohol dehydrogenase-like predicted oxidoreductase
MQSTDIRKAAYINRSLKEDHMERRDFLLRSALAGGGMMTLGLKNTEAFGSTAGGAMPMMTLGRTGEKVSMIGIGGGYWWHDSRTPEDIKNLFDRALDAGINYVDMAPNYGDQESEKRLGAAMEGKRDKVFLVNKTEEPTYEGTWRLLEQSLDNLKTDYIDVMHLHSIGTEDWWPNLDEAFSKKGAMQALREAKKKGTIKYIGATAHQWPSRMHYIIDSGEIDVLMVAVNYIIQHTYDFEHKIWARAKEENIGLVAMKVFGGFVPETGKFKIPDEDYEDALRYALSLDGISTTVLGVSHVEELERALRVMENFRPLTEDEFLALSMKGLTILQKEPDWRTVYGTPVT